MANFIVGSLVLVVALYLGLNWIEPRATADMHRGCMTTMNNEYKPLIASMEAEWGKKPLSPSDREATKVILDSLEKQKAGICDCFARRALENNGKIRVAMLHFGLIGASDFSMPSQDQFQSCQKEGLEKETNRLERNAGNIQNRLDGAK